MTAITIINILLAAATIAISSFGAFLNWRYTQSNIYRRYLNSMLLFWAIVITSVFFKFFTDGNPTISFVSDYASVPVLLLGIPCFLSIVLYPIVVLNASLIKPSNWWPLLAPIVIPTIIYFTVCYVAKINPLERYLTAADFFANITSLSVILRLLLIGSFAAYIIITLVSIHRTVPIYNQYIHDNISDSDCNVDWIQSLIRYITVVTFCYFALLFSNSTAINTLYLCSILALFSYLAETSIFHKVNDDITAIKLKFSLFRGWHVDEPKKSEPQIAQSLTPEITKYQEMIEKWMVEEQPYLDVDFTTRDILNKFPTFTHSIISSVFKSNNDTFQTYVRRFRINLACEIIHQDDTTVYPKLLFSRVGFSHYSSFSRAFVAVTGYTPTEYILLHRNGR